MFRIYKEPTQQQKNQNNKNKHQENKQKVLKRWNADVSEIFLKYSTSLVIIQLNLHLI